MNFLGLYYWLFIENGWWALAFFITLMFIFVFLSPNINLTEQSKNTDENLRDAGKIQQAIDDIESPLMNHRGKILIFLIFIYWFFVSIKPQWLPEPADDNRSEMKTSLYISPIGITNARGEFLYEKYECDFFRSQAEAIKWKIFTNADDKEAIEYFKSTDKFIRGWVPFCFSK